VEEIAKEDDLSYFLSSEQDEILFKCLRFEVKSDGEEWIKGNNRKITLLFSFLEYYKSKISKIRVCEEPLPNTSLDELLIKFALTDSNGNILRCNKNEKVFHAKIRNSQWNSIENQLEVVCDCVLHCTHRDCPVSEDSLLHIQSLDREFTYQDSYLYLGKFRSNRSPKRRKTSLEHFLDTILRWFHSWILPLYLCFGIPQLWLGNLISYRTRTIRGTNGSNVMTLVL